MGVCYNRQCRNCLEHRKQPKPPPEVDAGVGGAAFASLFFRVSIRQFWVSVLSLVVKIKELEKHRTWGIK